MNPGYSMRRGLLRLTGYVPGWRTYRRRESMVGPLGHWKQLRNYQLSALRAQGLRPHHHLLDLGCGPLQGGIAFIQYLETARYHGIDRSRAALTEGYRQIAEFQLAERNPRLLHTSRFDPPELAGQTFDFIWASQILYYFDAAMLTELFRVAARVLAPGGKLVGDILGECEVQFRSRRHLEWIARVHNHSVESLQVLATPLGLRVRSVGKILDFGYPPQLNLRSNLLLEITRQPNPMGQEGG